MNERAKDFQRFEQLLRPPKARGGSASSCSSSSSRTSSPPTSSASSTASRAASGWTPSSGSTACSSVDAVPARQLPARARRRRRAGRGGSREGVRARREGHIDASPRSTSAPTRDVRVRVHVPPTEGVYYELVCNRIGGDANPVDHAQSEGVRRLAEHLLHLPPHPGPGLQGAADRGARPRGHGLRRRSRDFARFKADFDVVGHLGNAQTKYAESERRLSASRRSSSGQRSRSRPRSTRSSWPSSQGSRRRLALRPALAPSGAPILELEESSWNSRWFSVSGRPSRPRPTPAGPGGASGASPARR